MRDRPSRQRLVKRAHPLGDRFVFCVEVDARPHAFLLVEFQAVILDDGFFEAISA
jgi:hypothetical protein